MARQPFGTTSVTQKKLKPGESYYIFIFNGKSHNIEYGKLRIDATNLYVFDGVNGLYKTFSHYDINSAKTGQPMRAEIRNGRLSFMALFISRDDAESVKESMPRNVAIRLIKTSIDDDRKMIKEVQESVMKRISMMNDVITSKNLSEVAASIKKSAVEKKNHFQF